MGSQLWVVTDRMHCILEVPQATCRQRRHARIIISAPSTLGKTLHEGILMEETWGPQVSGMWELEGVVAQGCRAELQRNIPNPFIPRRKLRMSLGQTKTKPSLCGLPQVMCQCEGFSPETVLTCPWCQFCSSSELPRLLLAAGPIKVELRDFSSECRIAQNW